MQIDFLIVGQGLAGSLLGWELCRRGHKILLVDNGKENASQVAAGLINPVTGQRFVKTADVDMLLPLARSYYATLQRFFRQTFFVEKPMLRLLRNEKERQSAEKRLLEAGYRDYLAGISEAEPNVDSPLGLLRQTQTGYLLTVPLLSALKNFFSERNGYLQADIDYADIKLEPELHWRHFRPRRIIFCEGHLARRNPWFNWLPWQPVKGEILTGFSLGEPIGKILNYGHWFIPLPDGYFKTGASFDRDRLDMTVTEPAKAALLRDLHRAYPPSAAARIFRQQAGIRPATQDRQPFIGLHPRYPRLAIFNGFGAKGSLLIPRHCQQFADTLLNDNPLPNHIDIKRHYESHFIA
ncbi:NAD(P)/FAD-dependent oxidoreductase [Methylomarinum vadi]|uniref:NAD(P)/FAD-dependent oxidoreductase n=1 Tax=Methylomarinum vadi TaxID=438855 RepID=UPI0004DF1CA9|nr:FAD-binding oxidoreductase [Methylomarinum vadi]